MDPIPGISFAVEVCELSARISKNAVLGVSEALHPKAIQVVTHLGTGKNCPILVLYCQGEIGIRGDDFPSVDLDLVFTGKASRICQPMTCDVVPASPIFIIVDAAEI